jgi:hypothetical protein
LLLQLLDIAAIKSFVLSLMEKRGKFTSQELEDILRKYGWDRRSAARTRSLSPVETTVFQQGETLEESIALSALTADKDL